jgi:hypothetical protein
MRIAGLYDELGFAKKLADPDRIQHAEANIGHVASGVGTVSPVRRKGARELRKHEFMKSHPARVGSRKERKRDG